MTDRTHRLYISVLVAIGFITFIILVYWGVSYYLTSVEERPFHESHDMLKPSGPIGHGLGIVGTLMILIGVFSYIGRKKKKFLPRVGALKHWLEFHIFLCSVGPLLILFHTAFKFGGIVSISFWSMVAVVLSGVIGRFIYIQIPRTIQGRELSLTEIKEMKDNLSQQLRMKYGFDEGVYGQLIAATTREAEGNEKGLVARVARRIKTNREIKNKVKTIFREAKLGNRDRKGVNADLF